MADAASKPPSGDPQALIGWAREALNAAAAHAARDPQTNSVRQLGLDLSEGLARGDLKIRDIAAVVDAVAREALAGRAARFRAHHDIDGADDRFAAARRSLEAAAAEGWDAFAARAGREAYGVVFTGHPTFAMQAEDYARLDRLIAGEDAPSHPLRAPRAAPSLGEEHAAAQRAIAHAREQIRETRRIALAVARERFPDRWTTLDPAILTLASWVSYDLDGRTDIHWGETFAVRLSEKADQLDRYAADLKANAPAIASRLEDAAVSAREEAAAFEADLTDPDAVVAAANRLTGADPRRLVRLSGVVGAIDTAIAAAKDDAAREALVLVRAEMRSTGLGTARIHLRVNAAQVRSALGEEFGIDDEVDRFGRLALDKAAAEAGSTSVRSVNFASIFFERMTARRQFMLCAQILKHVDAETPIRFLIAEAERPATVMGAIYLARRYGVAGMLDISPLFETPDGLERGGRFMEQLFDEPEYMRQARARGRVCVQIGYSDGGRFMGQIPADLASERLQILIQRELARRSATDVSVLVFNTHGESMGRGAHPGSFRQRLEHLTTRWTLSRYKAAGIDLIRESSFQGGDGFTHFRTAAAARSTISHIAAAALEDAPWTVADRYYEDINFSWDVYRSLKAWQERLFDDGDYRAALSSFGPALLYPTGSRKVRRQTGSAVGAQSPRSMRAIPNNAILQQLAAPANVCGGLGDAAAMEEDRFVTLAAGSPRMRSLLEMAARARALTSLVALRAYAGLFDPGFWLAQAIRTRGEGREAGLALAALHARSDTAARISGLAAHLGADLARFDDVLEKCSVGPDAEERRRGRIDLHVLHGARAALVMRGFLLAVMTPPFSERLGASRDDLLEHVFALRFRDAADLVSRLFPVQRAEAAALEGVAEPADDVDPHAAGYRAVQRDIVGPLFEIADAMDDVALAISQFYGAFG